VSAIYDRALHRYLIMTEHGRSFASRLTLLEAPTVWGPFRTVAYTTVEDPRGRVQSRAFHFNILPNSFSRDGKHFTLAFTGVGDGDALNLVDGSFAPGGKSAREASATLKRSALKASARRGAAEFANGLTLARQAVQGRMRPAAGGTAPGLDGPPEDEGLGLTAYPVGRIVPAALSPAPDPTRAGFERAYAPEGDDGGIGLDYGLPDGTRLGLVLTTRGDTAGGGAGLVSQDGVAAYLRQRLGALRLDTSFAYGTDGAGGKGRASFAGRTTSVAQRVGLPLRAGGGLRLTPWAGLAYVSQAADGFALRDPLLGEQRYDGVEVGDTLASLGVDGELAPVRLGEGAWLRLHGGLSYTQSLARDDYRVRVAALGAEHEETVGRPATRAVGLSLDGSLALGGALAVEGGLALEEDLAAGPAGTGQVRLSWRF
jgi:Autotransporter beta-domain